MFVVRSTLKPKPCFVIQCVISEIWKKKRKEENPVSTIWKRPDDVMTNTRHLWDMSAQICPDANIMNLSIISVVTHPAPAARRHSEGPAATSMTCFLFPEGRMMLLLCILFSQSNQIKYNIILYSKQNRETEKV